MHRMRLSLNQSDLAEFTLAYPDFQQGAFLNKGSNTLRDFDKTEFASKDNAVENTAANELTVILFLIKIFHCNLTYPPSHMHWHCISNQSIRTSFIFEMKIIRKSL